LSGTTEKIPLFAGIDIGSLSTKAALMRDGNIICHCIMQTGCAPQSTASLAFDEIIKSTGSRREQIACVVGTGYGRVNLSFANQTFTELTCHAKGAHYLNPAIRTVIDMGGQDSKIIRIDKDGNMIDFCMNDKCAAGTGRFLEVMARALEISMEDFGPCSLNSSTPCSITNTCAVFAESEVVSLLAAGQARQDIAAGLHVGIAQRVGNMARRIGIEGEVVFVGGVAKNTGVRNALEQFLGIQFVSIKHDPQINGAIGAALLAGEMFDEGITQKNDG
jgi:predicted CoA-substrate-specific enzyme activase